MAFVGNSQASELQMVRRYGRQDCGNSPREKAEGVPDPRMGLDGVLSWCSRVFDFSDRECVAILAKIKCGEALGVLLLLNSRSETFNPIIEKLFLPGHFAYLLIGIKISQNSWSQ